MSNTPKKPSKPTAKAGKAPVSEKETTSSFLSEFEGESPLGDMLSIPAALKKEIEDQGLAYKFINYKIYKESGMHKRGWKPYPIQSAPSGVQKLFGSSPEGYLVRGDCILAVIPTTWKNKIKEQIAQKNKTYANFNKQKADEFRKSLGGDSTVYEGYDNN